ncbi:MAG: corrinoid ABC transporter substrate-binding protein [Methanosaeta sp. PtaU1.Bin060]|nr:MAG: corrinoid ABC transporter substrate-binding protein [Methanosaeta sp. PtaU1.Bin060]
MNRSSLSTTCLRWIGIAVFIIFVFNCTAMAAESTGYPRSIVDDAGREITIKMPIEKIIPLDSCAAKLLYLIGAQDKIIAIGDDVVSRSGYLPDIKNKQSVGTWHEYDYELIGELARDGEKTAPNIVVLCTVNGMDPVKEIAPALEGFPDVAVIGLDTFKTENVTHDLEVLGVVLEKEDEVQKNIDWYNEKIAQVKSAVAGKSKPLVYNEMSSSKGTSELNSYGTTSSGNKLIEIANGYNVLREPKTYSKISWEWVMTQNPDIIMKMGAVDTLGWAAAPSQDAIGLENIINEILSRPGASTLSAVKENRVYVVWNSILSGFDNVVGAAYLAKIFHPEIDLDPDEISREYMSRLGLDLPKDRILVYPPIEESEGN